MRATVILVLATAGSVLAAPQAGYTSGLVSQISDGQVQAPTGSYAPPPEPSSSVSTTSVAPVIPSAPPHETGNTLTPEPSSTPVPSNTTIVSPVTPPASPAPAPYSSGNGTIPATGAPLPAPSSASPTTTVAITTAAGTTTEAGSATANPVTASSSIASPATGAAEGLTAEFSLIGAALAGLLAFMA